MENMIVKFLAVAIVVVFVGAMVAVLDEPTPAQEVHAAVSGTMEIINSDEGVDGYSYGCTLVDKETGVMYYYVRTTISRAGTSCTITPLYNEDGTLRVYKGK